MTPRIINNPLTPVLDQEFQQLQRFVDLSPFFRGFLGETFVNHGHDFVEELVVEGCVCDFLHHGGGGAPGFVVGCFADFGLHFCVVHDGILDFADAGFEVVEGQIAGRFFEGVEVHGRWCEGGVGEVEVEVEVEAKLAVVVLLNEASFHCGEMDGSKGDTG